jgi:hypothetical protein
MEELSAALPDRHTSDCSWNIDVGQWSPSPVPFITDRVARKVPFPSNFSTSVSTENSLSLHMPLTPVSQVLEHFQQIDLADAVLQLQDRTSLDSDMPSNISILLGIKPAHHDHCFQCGQHGNFIFQCPVIDPKGEGQG